MAYLNLDPPAAFDVRIADRCTPQVAVAVRNVATRSGPRTQVRQATRHGVATIGEGTGKAGPWRIVELADSNYGEPLGFRPVYGIASQRLARRRYLQVRAIVNADLACTDEQLRDGAFAKALGNLLRTADADVVIRKA